MRHHRSIVGLAALLIALSSACGDWPWPMNKPDDPSRCQPACEAPYSCQDGSCVYDPCRTETCSGHGQCAVKDQSFSCSCKPGFAGVSCGECDKGYVGYPSCAKDVCFNNSCSGHGSCSNNACVCTKGYAGAACDTCAAGFTGYPSCACECSTQAQTCVGTSLKYCDGCSFVTKTCDQICPAPQHGGPCAKELTTGIDACYCVKQAGNSVMVWTFTNNCNDGTSVTAAVFDHTAGKLLTAWLVNYGKAGKVVECVPGHSICYGAYKGSKSWGCGETCSLQCSGCCATCGSQILVGPLPFEC